MKKIKYLFLLLIAIMVIPVSVFAEEEKSTDSESKKVKVYIFRGEGCSHCKEALEWFDSIKEEYGNQFELVQYEVWYDEDNNKLMEKVAKARDEEADGVPYIIIGNKSWNGFAESYQGEILSEIKSEYGKDLSSRYDVMKYVKSGKSNKKKESVSDDIISLLVILVLVCGLGFGIYKARKNVE